MKAIIYTIFFTLTVIFSSCNYAQNQSLEERIKGDWVVIEAVGDFKELNLGMHYTFDGTHLTTSKDNFEVKGTYTIKPDTIDWKLENMEMNYPYRFEKNKLIIEPIGSGQKLILKK